MQKTLIIIKPDAVARGLGGKIMQRFEEKGLRIVGMRMQKINAALAGKHYAEHKGKPFYKSLVKFITSSPVVVMVVEGRNAIKVCRTLVGATDGAEAAPGTIRGDFGCSRSKNLVHASDSPKSAKREVALFFKRSELVKYTADDIKHNYEFSGGQAQ